MLESPTSWEELNIMDDLLEEVRLYVSKRPAKQKCYSLVHNDGVFRPDGGRLTVHKANICIIHLLYMSK